jgi:hypothetical protein
MGASVGTAALGRRWRREASSIDEDGQPRAEGPREPRRRACGRDACAKEAAQGGMG